MISLIACVGKNNEIGKNGDLCWRLKADLKTFKRYTIGHTVVMGYNTYKSLGFKPLADRRNIVITRERFNDDSVEQIVPRTLEENGVVHNTWQDFLKEMKKSEEEFWIIGGGQLYRHTIRDADRIILTKVPFEDSDADTFFPDFSVEDYDIVEARSLGAGVETIDYRRKDVDR